MSTVQGAMTLCSGRVKAGMAYSTRKFSFDSSCRKWFSKGILRACHDNFCNFSSFEINFHH